MRRRERARHLRRDRQRLAQRHRATLESLAQRLTFDELRHDERSPVDLAEVVNDEDVRVIQR